MKKSTPIILIFLAIFSCSKKMDDNEKKMEESAEIFLTKQFQKNYDFDKINSLKFIKIDTVTEKSQANFYYDYLYSKTEIFIEMGKNYSNLSKIELDKTDYERKSNKINAKKNLDLSYKYLDSAKIFENKRQKLAEQINKFDSLKPKFLEVGFEINILSKNGKLKKDSAFLIYDLNSNIIDNKNFIKTIEEKLNGERYSR